MSPAADDPVQCAGRGTPITWAIVAATSARFRTDANCCLWTSQARLLQNPIGTRRAEPSVRRQLRGASIGGRSYVTFGSVDIVNVSGTAMVGYGDDNGIGSSSAPQDAPDQVVGHLDGIVVLSAAPAELMPVSSVGTCGRDVQ